MCFWIWAGVYSVTIDAQEGTALVSGEVDPNILLRALISAGKHAEIVWIKLKHPTLNGRVPPYYYSHNNNSIYGPSSSSSYSYGATDEPSYYGRSLELPQQSYYYDTHRTRQRVLAYEYPSHDTHHQYYPQRRQPALEYDYPYYSRNYLYDTPLPPAQYVPSAPQPVYDPYEDEPISFCSIM
ncbi:hypothetical protein LguiA_035695 [Lonicera macranthoides]